MFFNRRATIRCVLDSITPNIAFSAHRRDRALWRSAQPRSIGCEISRKAGINRREKNLSSDENPLGLIASEKDDSSSEIILQTETTGLGPIQIFSFYDLNHHLTSLSTILADKYLESFVGRYQRIQYLNRP